MVYHCNTFNALIPLVEQQEGHPACKKTGCWFVGGDDLTASLHVLQLQLLSLPPSFLVAPIKSRMETFGYWLTQVHLANWPLKRREREITVIQVCK